MNYVGPFVDIHDQASPLASPMQNLLDKPIFVTGLPGPETSLVAELLHAGGAWIGNDAGPGPNQRADSWQNRQISGSLIKPILAAMQCDPLNARSLPPTYSTDRTTAIRRPVRGIGEALHAILRGQGYDSTRPWLYQDPNLLLLWPNFVEALPGARWLVVRRNLDHFIQSSALQRPGAGHTSDESSWINLGAAYLQRIDGLRDYNGSAREIWMDDLATGGPGALLAIFEHLDLSWDPRVIRQIVDRGYRQDRVLKEQALEVHTSAHTSTSALRLVKHYRTGQHYTVAGSTRTSDRPIRSRVSVQPRTCRRQIQGRRRVQSHLLLPEQEHHPAESGQRSSFRTPTTGDLPIF
jgi:hypothetical protein